ncbi:MAG: hypothetical protein PHU44_01310 [Syntrophales bacterium]|nr:hypothetical protein [Syntrophales bacterium]MDD5643317.1 hypothetical protein [Syntrophales bacterium]
MNLWKLIFSLAKYDESILHQLCGIKIFNKKVHQYGIINKIDDERIYISFENRPNCKYKYNEFSVLFDNSFIDQLPISLKEKLKYKNLHLKDRFLDIIFKIHDGINLNGDDINFILERNAYELLGKYYEKNIGDDKWHIVTAAKYYRKAGLVDKGLALTNIENIQQDRFNQHKDFKKFMAAVLTAHGACLRDDGNLPKAEKCAWDALKYDESFYPYNLLGAIYIDKGKIKQGDDLFQQAEALGSGKKNEILNSQKSFIISVVNKSPIEAKTEIARYFYYKDNKRYGFLKKYL